MICDDIYHKLTFDRNVAVPAYHFTKKDIENSHVIVVNGVAKLYGMTGFRIGWVVAPRDLVRVMTNVTGADDLLGVTMSAGRSEGALNGLQSVMEALRLQIQNNRDVVLAGDEDIQRRAPDRAERDILCPAGPPCIQYQFRGSVKVPAQKSDGRDSSWQGVWHGRTYPHLFRWDGEGCDRGHCAHQMGARPHQPE